MIIWSKRSKEDLFSEKTILMKDLNFLCIYRTGMSIAAKDLLSG